MDHTLHDGRPVLAATMTARQQLAAVLRWARTNGWTRESGPRRGWASPDGAAAVEYIDGELIVHSRNEYGGWRARLYPVSTIREGIEQLVTIGLLPPEASPVYGAGYGAGWREAQLRQETAVVAQADRIAALARALGGVQVAAWCAAPGDDTAQLAAVRSELAKAGFSNPFAEMVAAHREAGLVVGGAER